MRIVGKHEEMTRDSNHTTCSYLRSTYAHTPTEVTLSSARTTPSDVLRKEQDRTMERGRRGSGTAVSVNGGNGKGRQ